jgi:uncharacterized LabA/DUF88 family protein
MPSANVYVDGFNLYYRSVKNTPYKWLNLAALAQNLVPQGTTIHRIRYFAATVRAVPGDPGKPTRQQVYFRALRTIQSMTIHLGHFLTHTVSMPLADPPPGGPVSVKVLKTEEKGSDVNLATYLLLDVFKQEADMALVISNDSDLAEPMRVVQQHFGMKVGIALPDGGTPSRTLMDCATFTKWIRRGVLAASQFPAILTDAKGTFAKPASW